MDDKRYAYVVTARDGEYEADVDVIGVFDSMQEALDAVSSHKFDVFANVEALAPREFIRRAARGERTIPRVCWYLDNERTRSQGSNLVQPLRGIASFKPTDSSNEDHAYLELRDDEFGVLVMTAWESPDIEIKRVEVGVLDYEFRYMPEHDDDRLPDPVEFTPENFEFAVEQYDAVMQRLVDHINHEMRKLEERIGRKLTEKEARDYAEGVFYVFFRETDKEILLHSDESRAWSMFNDERIGNGRDEDD